IVLLRPGPGHVAMLGGQSIQVPDLGEEDFGLEGRTREDKTRVLGCVAFEDLCDHGWKHQRTFVTSRMTQLRKGQASGCPGSERRGISRTPTIRGQARLPGRNPAGRRPLLNRLTGRVETAEVDRVRLPWAGHRTFRRASGGRVRARPRLPPLASHRPPMRMM